ncbi:MAG: C2 family cysteine protease [Oscillatoria sp. Prado101]|nr:C2 family cysteine protease [Oscillatoria sp. Prado101]
MAKDLFDVNYYRQANPDLAAAGLTTDQQLWLHFQQFGLNEGRPFSPLINLNFYRQANPDLKAAGLTTNKQLFEHLQNKGLQEGRKFSPFIDLEYYLEINPDLQQAFQGNLEHAYDHLLQFGLAEQRKLSPFYDPNYYLANNPDLLAAGLKGRQLLEHLENTGLEESRPFSPAFDVQFYRNANPDLRAARLNNRQLLEHFESTGIKEGRASKENFNVRSYLESSPDLQAAGFNFERAYKHYITTGIREPRRTLKNGSFLTGSEVADFIQGEITINSKLSFQDKINPQQEGTFAKDYILDDVTAGQQVQVTLTSTQFSPRLELLDALTGEAIPTGSDSNSALNFTAQQGVRYAIRVTSDPAKFAATGNFTLTADASNPIVASLAVSSSLSNALATTDLHNPTRLGTYSDDYRLTGVSAGQIVQISANSGQFETYLQVIDALTGMPVAETKDFGRARGDLNSAVTFTADAGTNYIVRVTSFNEDTTGSYTLNARLVSTPLSDPTLDLNSLEDEQVRTDALTLSVDGQLSRNDMLQIFDRSTDNDIVTKAELQDFKALVQNQKQFYLPPYVAFISEQVVQDACQIANSLGTVKTAPFKEIVDRWFRGIVQPYNPSYTATDGSGNSRIFNLELQRLTGQLYGSSNSPQISQVSQNQFADSFLIAAVGATFRPVAGNNPGKSSQAIAGAIFDNGDGTYGVRFYENGAEQWVTVNQDVAVYAGEIYGAADKNLEVPSNPNNRPIWITLLEKAYAAWQQWQQGDATNGYKLISRGGDVSEALSQLTSRKAEVFKDGDNRATGTFADLTFERINQAFDEGRFVAASTDRESAASSAGLILANHPYAVTDVYVTDSNAERIVVFNPWGVDGPAGSRDRNNDGFIDLSFEEFQIFFADGTIV